MLQAIITPTVFKRRSCEPVLEIDNETAYRAETALMSSDLCGLYSPDRPEVEKFIQRIFRQAYGANVRNFMPKILCLRDTQRHLRAVAGMRYAEKEDLFLERYLDKPVEDVIASHAGVAVFRHGIVEIGNLAVEDPLYTRLLMAVLGRYFYSTDAEWLVFSALPVVINAVARMKHSMLVLGNASLDCIPPEERADWGSYYQHRPKVVALRRHNCSSMKG